ncbi:Cytochrome P450 [Mycena sanguinolenta]|uniref:Cytochrome P450 n=1 Tax=Mycena sanguinolenta TaxID=230812 RepID=A0A8H6XWF8_9AGAR|nr:Cytochrome P450 [Mycena sanguinolenta]
MAFQELLPAVVLVSVLFTVATLLRGCRTKIRLPFPPGPKPKFLLGNLFDIPTAQPWLTYTKWGKQYGDVVHVQAFGNHILILNSVKAATELLEKRAILYSDRPTFPMLPISGGEWMLVFMQHGDRWREHKRMFHQYFRREAIPAYHPIQLKKIQDLLRGLLSTPEDFEAHVKTLGAAIIMATTYGYDIQPTHDRRCRDCTHYIEQSSIFMTGFQQTSVVLALFIMAMAINPEVMKKAQNEIDTVVGVGILPGFEHRSAMPYCEAVMREVLRWKTIIPLALPHATSEDDIYEGYFIPKGTTVLPNV